MSHDSANASPDLIEQQLVAYLDGELDAEGSHRVEELLAADPTVRQRLQRLERTWEMLDQLERSAVDEKFTRSTLEMLTVAAEEEVDQLQSEMPRRRRRWLIASGSLLAAGLAGFLVVALALPDPNRQLLEDLPVLENLDQYRHVDDIEFLRELNRENLFVEEPADAP